MYVCNMKAEVGVWENRTQQEWRVGTGSAMEVTMTKYNDKRVGGWLQEQSADCKH